MKKKDTLEEMRRKAKEEQNSVELRSEKVRNMIGEMPPFLILWGNILLLVACLVATLVTWLLLRGHKCCSLTPVHAGSDVISCYTVPPW